MKATTMGRDVVGNVVEKTEFTSISLFSGCMGLDLGFEKAGIKTVVAVERDPSCLETIGKNRPDVVRLNDVCAVTGREIRRIFEGNRPDVLVGGPPCQSFSTIGRRGSVGDERGRMILEYLRLVKEIRPTCFVMENVIGILSAKKDGKPLMPWLISEFEKLGYNVAHAKLNAFVYGTPQNRMRVIVVGNRKGKAVLPTPRASVIPDLRAAIADLENDPGECGKFSAKVAKILQEVPEGGCWKDLPPEIANKAMGKANRKSGGLTAFYRRLSYNRPSPTLLTSPTQRATTLCHPKQTRPLSIEEYKRIQGFPADWALSGSISDKYRMLGNAVPVFFAEAIGKAVVSMLS